MLKHSPPIPQNEMERLLELSDLDIDYTDLNENFKDLTMLAAKIAGTEISLVNLIDAYTQWTISNHGIDLQQMDRTDSVCQYTLMEDDHFEVADLARDGRFNDKFYVQKPIALRYYFGVPLKSSEGTNIGALCVLDTNLKTLNPEKQEMLKIIADEIVNRIKTYKTLNSLRNEIKESSEAKRKVAHDIRGPLAGIIGLSEIISQQGDDNKLEEVMEFVNLIHKSSKSILELADEILTDDKGGRKLTDAEYNLLVFKDKLHKLYDPQAIYKKIKLLVNVNPGTERIPFSKNKLLQITGNLISNAIKFTPEGGTIKVDLDLIVQRDDKNLLSIQVSDNGVGLTQDAIDEIIEKKGVTTNGTSGEKGYGFGLALVIHLIEGLKGSIEVASLPEQGATFKIILPQEKG
ncbi:MAG: sensor histidine kinase [Pedobacter sp.]|nr:MAG: sensor histidine kinase [Pedobacter sp.]